MECYVFEREPRNAAYKELIRYCCSLSNRLLLVVRDPHLDPGDEIRSLLRELEPSRLQEALVSEWPGTRLHSGKATCYVHRVSPKLENTMRTAMTHLFGWIHPHAPEDPCFLRKSDAVLLTTISHERDAYLMLEEPEVDALYKSFPEVAAILRKET